MTPQDMTDIASRIGEFSLLYDLLPGSDAGTDPSSIDFHDVLLALASRLRRRDRAYHIEYQRPDQPVFRLRSDRTPAGESAVEKRFNYREPGRWLLMRVEPPGEDVIEGLSHELKILGELDRDEEGMTRESRLNLLVSRTFHAELYAEYQRWKRYDSPLLVVVLVLQDDAPWEPGARALKHVSGTRDMVGRLRVDRLAAFFPAVEDPSTIEQDLRGRMTGAYPDGEARLAFHHLPGEIQDWNTLKNEVFEPLSDRAAPEETALEGP